MTPTIPPVADDEAMRNETPQPASPATLSSELNKDRTGKHGTEVA